MNPISPTTALMALNAVPGIGNKSLTRIVESMSGFERHLFTPKVFLESKCLSQKGFDSLKEFPLEEFLKSEMNAVEASGVTVISILDDAYPSILKSIPDAPVILYARGSLECLKEGPAVSIVGSRKATLYGLSTAQKFARELAENRFVVVSGLARGIDTAAHRGCLQGRGKTIAVLGCGLNYLYPPENERLAREIIETGGAIISEFPMAAGPMPFNFPRRNRIVSGLAGGVLVVEAHEKSGALGTADFALEQGRDVYAIPGPIDSLTSSGTNRLIQQGAKAVASVLDILVEYPDHGALGEIKQQTFQEHTKQSFDQALSEEETQLWKFISSGPVHIDEIVARTTIGAGRVAGMLSALELKNRVKQLPGHVYQTVNQ